MCALRVMVVDDSSTYRHAVRRVLSGIADVEVVATASNGQIALQKLAFTEVDVMTLDVDMPLLGGLETLAELGKLGPLPCDVVMVSGLTSRGAHTTLRALELGAYDFVSKPSGGSMAENERHLKNQLLPILAGLKARQIMRGDRPSHARRPPAAPSRPVAAQPAAPAHRARHDVDCETPVVARAHPVGVVAIGISTGGPAALAQVIPKLPASLAVPIVLVQHMPPGFTETLAASLDRKSAVRVLEANDGMYLAAGSVYIAPGGKQMRLVKRAGRLQVEVNDAPPENNCKPSADYLFRSVAAACGKRALGVIMTGMGHDGVAGLHEMRAVGAYILAQDAATSVVYGMPGEAVKAGVVDEVLALDQIPCRIERLLRVWGAR